jgi:superfamily I DNA/RNA helicase
MKRFPPNTWCQTINSAAWDAASPALRGKLTNSFTPLLLRDELKIRTNREAGLVLRLLNQFMSSSDHELKPSHARAISSWNASEAEIQTAMSIARLAWFRMISETDKLPLPHDALLKLWSLRKPRLDFDYIIFDEAQDTNAVTADIISQQHHATRLYIGDRHQSVYAFRGATNAMEQMSENRSARQFHLSQTWRFGPKIAGVANLILNEIKGEQTPIIGMGSDGDWKKGARYTKLSRTNAQLFRDAAARQGEGVHWAGANGIAGYNINRVLEGYNLFAGRECKDSTLRRFRSWRDAQDYAEESRDNEVRMLVSVIDEFRHDTPDVVKTLVANEVQDVNNSSVVYSTAHKAKGLDWDYVELAEDFEVLNQVEKDLAKDAAAPIDDQEVNLLYVACTRAKTSLHLNSETRNWIANIEKHRQDRTLSMQRLQLRQDALRQSRESLRA